MRQPAIYLSHGGGPWPFVDIPFIPAGALEPLRSYLPGFNHAESTEPSRVFDEWLARAVTAEPGERARLLEQWEHAPAARYCHPREEHLLPLHVMAGAALDDPATLPVRMKALEVHVSGGVTPTSG